MPFTGVAPHFAQNAVTRLYFQLYALTGGGKSEPTRETACPTSLQLLDLPWWGRRFRLPFGTFAEPATR